ncbi:hypothetical protein MKX01_033755 [Papaver californicum]|nr:hypothetical protein MKX01_033755 [Papaver californicum]
MDFFSFSPSSLEILIPTFCGVIVIYFLPKRRQILLLRNKLPYPPGPKPWPVIGNLPHLGMAVHQNPADMVKTYGPVIYLRLGSVNVVVACSASIASQFLKTHGTNFSNRSRPSGAKHIAYNCQDLISAQGSRLRILRKICVVHLFSGKALDEFRYVRENLFATGTDTTTSTLEWALAELIQLDSVVGKDRLVSESDLSQLPFQQAAIKEVFRLHPSTPLSLPRVSTEDCEIGGCFIPKNTTLLTNVWAIARDPSMWTDPLKFKPERFLPVIPFGAGRRICVGLSLGLRMVQFMAATLIHGFDWELPEGQVIEKLNMNEAYGLRLQRASPLMVHPKPRLEAHVYSAIKF